MPIVHESGEDGMSWWDDNQDIIGGNLNGTTTIAEGRSITPDQAEAQVQQALAEGVPESYARDFLSRNPGDTNRLIESYASELKNKQQARPIQQSVSSSDGGGDGTGAPTAYRPYDKTFAFNVNDFLNDPGRVSTINEALQALERRASSAGRLGVGVGKDEAALVTDLNNKYYNDAYSRALQGFNTNYGVYSNDEAQRFGSERTNRMDTQSILDDNRNYALSSLMADRNYGLAKQAQDFGIDQSIWGRGNTERQQDRGFLLDAAQIGNPASIAGPLLGATGAAGEYGTQGANATAASLIGSGNAWSNALGSGVPIAQAWALRGKGTTGLSVNV